MEVGCVALRAFAYEGVILVQRENFGFVLFEIGVLAEASTSCKMREMARVWFFITIIVLFTFWTRICLLR